MNYKLLVLLILLLSVSFYSLKTGWISSESLEQIQVTVITTEVDLTVDVPVPSRGYYCPGELVNVSNALTNTGNTNATGDLLSWILDSNDNQVHSDSWSDINLSVTEIKTYNTSYGIPSDPAVGTYTAGGNFSYDSKFSYSSDTFEVSKGIGTFIADTNPINVIIAPGNSTYRDKEFSLQDACDNTIVFLNTTSGIPGDWVSFIPSNLSITPIIVNSTTVNISVPRTFITTGTYNGTIFAYADDPYAGYQLRTIPLSVTVAGLVFELNVSIPLEKKQVCQGEGVSAVIDIGKNQPGLMDINMTYQIRNLTGYVFDEVNETLQINQSLHLSKTLSAPTILGDYRFFVTLQYDQMIVNNYDEFKVIECIPPPPPPPPPTPTPPPLPVYGLNLRLSTDILTVIRGNRTSFVAYVNNTGTGLTEGIRVSVSGIPLNWLEIIPIETSIPVGESKEFLVSVNVPEDADVGIRRLEVKAKDKVESNIEVLTLVIGRDPKEIADLLLLELERVRASANESLLVEECIDISMIKSYYEDAELARENGLKEYDLGNFVQASDWFEYAIPVYIKVQRLIDMTLEVEIERLRTTKFIAPPTFDQEREYRIAKSYLEEKNYQKICEPIGKMRMVTMSGLIFWPVLIIVAIVLVIISIILYKKKKRIEREMILERVKKRLESKETTHEHLYPRFSTFRKIKNLFKPRKEKSE